MNNMDEKNCYNKCGSKKNISKAYKKIEEDSVSLANKKISEVLKLCSEYETMIENGTTNEELSEAIPFIYDDASSFKNGKAYVEKDDEFFFIDKYNNIIEKDKPKRLNLTK